MSQPWLKNNPNDGLFCAYAYPAPYPEYPDQLRGGFLTVVMMCARGPWPTCLPDMPAVQVGGRLDRGGGRRDLVLTQRRPCGT